MNIDEFAKQILLGTSIEDKLLDFSCIDKKIPKRLEAFIEIPTNPGRENKISISKKQVRFPKIGNFDKKEARGRALHFFANHELMAIEMMAAAILKYPTKDEEDIRFKEELVKTIVDEQKHFSLYKKRFEDLGVEFGDFPLNDFFWRQIHNLKRPEEFYALVALTFEVANLDFAKYYHDIFLSVEDQKTAAILDVVYRDEIVHVSRGNKWLNHWKGSKKLWDYYLELLPEKITPARGKGPIFDSVGRKRAGLSSGFIDSSINYEDDFAITNRKNWK